MLDSLLPPNLVLPPLPVLAPSVLSHLAGMAINKAGDAAVRSEACRCACPCAACAQAVCSCVFQVHAACVSDGCARAALELNFFAA